MSAPQHPAKTFPRFDLQLLKWRSKHKYCDIMRFSEHKKVWFSMQIRWITFLLFFPIEFSSSFSISLYCHFRIFFIITQNTNSIQYSDNGKCNLLMMFQLLLIICICLRCATAFYCRCLRYNFSQETRFTYVHTIKDTPIKCTTARGTSKCHSPRWTQFEFVYNKNLKFFFFYSQ